MADERAVGSPPRRAVPPTAGLVALAALLPGEVTALAGIHPPPPVAALLFGVAIVGAAFLLAWAAEAVQVDVSAVYLALAVVVVIRNRAALGRPLIADGFGKSHRELGDPVCGTTAGKLRLRYPASTASGRPPGSD
jgi:cation:H+ antiporter